MHKPAAVFDRDREWRALDAFVTAPRPGASLGLVYGRRRQGKTYLLETLAEEHRGFYFTALEQSAAQNLGRLAEKYREFTASRAPVAFSSWEQAMEVLLALGERADTPVVVVLDEFPYLIDGVPELASILQALLSPKGPAAQGWRTRLLLCGSALSTMRSLLDGTAPLRGRAALELMVHPFTYRDAAAFWHVEDDPELALRLHALVGGTPAYLDMCNQVRPASAETFDEWVADTLLDPASAMFREGNVLVSEEEHVSDAAVYFSVLAAISIGRTRRSEIASTLGRPEGSLSHPLRVLEGARLVEAVGDALKQKRTTFHVAEPILRLHQLVVAPNQSRLDRHLGSEVWAEVADTVSARIYGPHLEHLARTWCVEHAAAATLGGAPSRVGPTDVACRAHKATHEVDLVVVEVAANQPDRVVALGEVKWRSVPCAVNQVERLEHIRELLEAPDAHLLVFSRSGFGDELSELAAGRDDIELVDLARLYTGS